MTLKLKRTPGLYLVGFMGCGKTTVGESLAGELGWCFVDIDTDIERREQKTIADIFSERGEAAFRDIEAEMIRERVLQVEAGMPCVVALGGGALLRPRNWELVANNGVTVWLDCPLEKVRERLNGDYTRPLARDPGALEQLYAERRPLYSRADYHVDVDGADLSETIGKILQLPIF